MACELQLPPGYTYDKKLLPDEIIILIKEVQDELSAKKWLQDWSDITKVTWWKRTTYPRSGKQNCYKVDMKCQHAKDKRVKGVHSKKTGCTAMLQIKIAKSSENGDAGEWPTTVTIRGSHNHPLDCAEVLKFRDLSENSRNRLRELFQKGHTAASALETFKSELLFEYKDEYFKIAADGYYVPSYSKVHKLFEKEFISEYEPFNDVNFEYFKKQLDIYNLTTEGTCKFFKTSDNNNYFVVICTPIMKRVHEAIPQSSELVLVDASGGMDKQRHRIYVFITPTAAGGLPLGIIISDTEKEHVFSESLLKLKEIFPENSFFGKKEPQVFITDNDFKE